jgi:NAD(P)-dependent dehydrogenase (short-subunit alcohol dehydrogenase family)
MDLQLSGKHVLITGGSKGIGLACAHAFLGEGSSVSLVSRDAANLERAAAVLRAAHPGARITTQVADTGIAAQALAALEQAQQAGGAIDVLVNSAGAARRTPADELTPQAWADAMQAKYFACVYMMDAVVKRMAQRGSGAIVNVIGAGGKVASSIHLPGGAANAALMLVTAGLANTYAPKGVRVNAVNPGLTLTDRMAEGLAADARVQGISADEALQRAKSRLPLGRIATPEEVAAAVVFLASPRASYISGAILALDGAVTPIVV